MVFSEGCADNNIMGLIPKSEGLLFEYLGHWLQSQELYDWSNKANPPSITQTTVSNVKIPLPPLEEQRRIVAILDDALAGLETAVANAEANLKDAEELFRAHLNVTFSNALEANQIPMRADWEFAEIASFAHTSAGGTPLKSNKNYYEGGTIPWLLSGEVGVKEITKATNFITELGLKESSAKLFPPDTVLIAMYGATAGEVGILRFEASTNQAVCAVLPSARHLPEFIYYFLLHYKPDLIKKAAGSGQPNISQAKIKSINVPLPPIEQQRRIAAILDSSQFQTDHLKKNINYKISQLRDLKQSLLQKAFAGELT